MWFWLAAAALFGYLVQRILGIRGPISRTLRLVSGALSFIVSSALFWWLFDVPGFIRQQQAIARWDTTERLPEYHPVVEMNGRTVTLAGGALLLVLGLVMLVRPEVYLKDVPKDVVLFGAARPEPVSTLASLRRFRIYGFVITLGGLIALWAGITAW